MLYGWYSNVMTAADASYILISDFSFAGIMQQDNSEQVIIDPRLIAKHYIRSWFFLDLVSSIPLDYIFLIVNSVTGSGVRIDLRCLRMGLFNCKIRTHGDFL